jgi:hypothetical protein
VLNLVVGLVLLARGLMWTNLMRRAMRRQDPARRWDKRTMRRILVMRGLGSMLVGFTVIVELYDIAIVLAVALVLWELSHLRRRRQSAS